jgi:hypothetical protein
MILAIVLFFICYMLCADGILLLIYEPFSITYILLMLPALILQLFTFIYCKGDDN